MARIGTNAETPLRQGLPGIGGDVFNVLRATNQDNPALTATAAPAALTDSSGGSSGGNTIAAVTDSATAANAVATLAAKVNAIRTALVSAGILT